MSAALISVEDIDPLEVFTNDGVKPIIEAIRDKATDFEADASTVKGRKEIASMAAKVSRSKTFLDGIGKELVADWKAKAKVVDISRRTIRDELDKLKEEIRKPLTDWEAEEQARADRLSAEIAKIESLGSDLSGCSSEDLSQRLEAATAWVISPELDGYYKDKAELAKYKSIDAIKQAIEALKVEAERIEAERKRVEQEQKDRVEAIRKEAEAKAKAEAEQKAEQERKQQQEELQRAKEAEAKAKADAEKARQDERDRIEAEAKARKALQDKREEDDEHRRVVISVASASLCEKISLNQDVAMAIVKAIADGEIKHLKVEF